MRKLSYIILFTAITIAVGCKSGGASKENIVGKWKVAEADFDIKDFDKLPKNTIEEVQKALLNTTYEFKADGSYSMSYFERSVEGKWSYDNNKNTLTLKSDEEGVDENIFLVKSSSEKKMEVLNDKGEEGSIELSLEKVESKETEKDKGE